MAETIVQGPAGLDAGVARVFEQELAAATSLGSKRLLVDRSKTRFISSIALRSLLTTARRLATEGGRMVVFITSTENHRLLSASGLDQVIPVHNNLAEARAALAG